MCSSSLKALALSALLVIASPAQARELRVCADPNNLPFSNESEEGFENRIVAVIAEELGAEVRYTWWAQRRGFLRNTLKAEICDLVPGLPANLEGVRTTAPYYRSSYAFVTRPGGPEIKSLDDVILRHLTIGVHLIGDDGSNTPPAHALARRGIIENVRGYMIYGDYDDPNPPMRILEALVNGDIDVAIVWGPFGGYLAQRGSTPLKVTPVLPKFDGPGLPMVFDISMAVRREDEALRQEVDAALARRRPEVDAILDAYGVLRLAGDMGHVERSP